MATTNKEAASLYGYKARVVRVVDGDTLVLDVDLGFSVVLKGQTLRMARVNAPERKGATLTAGDKSKEALRARLEGKEVTIRTFRGGEDKYGRILADVYLDGECVNDWLLQEGLAVSFMA